MTQQISDHQRMWLSGYVKLAPNGFALPVYGLGNGANARYLAVPTIQGDHTSTIAGFELLENEDIVPLPNSEIVVGPGDPWQDVFLWDDEVLIGTPKEIFESIAVDRDTLNTLAPLSYLDLAVAAESPDSAVLAANARRFLETRSGTRTGAAFFVELVLRPGILVALRRQFFKRVHSDLPEFVRDFTVVERDRGQFEVTMASGMTAAIGGDEAAAGLCQSIRHFGEIVGVQVCEPNLDKVALPEINPEPPLNKHLPSLGTDGRIRIKTSLPNILIIAADRRAAQIARFLLPPTEVAFGSGSILVTSEYRIETETHTNAAIVPDDSLILICDELDLETPLEAFAVVVWLAGNEVFRSEKSEKTLNILRLMNKETPFLIAPAPPSDGPSTLLEREWENSSFMPPCSAIIDTTLARSPFWSGPPRRSVDRRMADIVATVSIVAAMDDLFRKALKEKRWPERPQTISFNPGQNKFAPQFATASELNAAGARGYIEEIPDFTLFAFEFRDSFPRAQLAPETMSRKGVAAKQEFGRGIVDFDDWSTMRVQNGSLVLQPLQHNFPLFAESAAIEALGTSISLPGPLSGNGEVPAAIRRTLDNPEFAVSIGGPGTHHDHIVVTAEAPSLEALLEGEVNRATIVRYTDVETIRAIITDERPRKLPREIRLPSLYQYPRNLGLVTRGVDTRNILKLPESQWQEMLTRHPRTELGGEARRYLAAAGNRFADSIVALPIWSVRNSIKAGDALANELSESFRSIKETKVFTGKQRRDLITSWTHPARGMQRWVVEDGRLPVVLKRIEPSEVPAQRLFFIDGDGAVPVFLLSRMFAVWARSMLPSSTSWASRFQVSKTFDAFPFPRCFQIFPSSHDNPPYLQLSGEGASNRRLASLAGDDALRLAEVLHEFGHDEVALRDNPAMRRIDTILLENVQLSQEASDLEILERLIDLNLKRE